MITINKIKFKDSWKEVTISEYDKIVSLLNEGDIDLATEISILSLLSGEPEDTFWNAELKEMQEYKKALDFLNDFTLEEADFKNLIIAGKKFKVQKDWTSISVSQYYDINCLINTPSLDRKLARMLSVYVWPAENKEYEPSDEVIEFLYKNCPFSTCQSILNFGLRKIIDSLSIFLTSSIKKKNKREKELIIKRIDKMIEELEALIS